ncbi:hypothetical protein GCM10022222_17470 [Amycolatopsis ultiminotia]|uniref:Uncharacterized protein n=1 Tax=Amycolatopsis ultiminotia TaxID=543629 RepID=A0ABP6VIS9_9PSEU
MAVQRGARACGLLLQSLRFDEHAIRRPRPAGWILARLGVAAKSVFTIVRGGSFAWTVPPAVSERAAQLALPLMNITMPDDIDLRSSAVYRQALAEFVADAAYLIIAGRPDLLPRIRQHYNHRLHLRAPDLAEHDIRYLDPMRGRSPWDVTKEHIIPTVALLITLAALLIRK